MSKQLAISSAISVMMMAIFVLWGPAAMPSPVFGQPANVIAQPGIFKTLVSF